MSTEVHQHCLNCIDINKCTKQNEDCRVVACQHNCRARFHECKRSEHDLICPNARVPCINNQNGCPLSFPRKKVAEHLKVCPASVILCKHFVNIYNRGLKDGSGFAPSFENQCADLRRDEFSEHMEHVHGMTLNRQLKLPCPFHSLGCPEVFTNIIPASPKADFCVNVDENCMTLRHSEKTEHEISNGNGFAGDREEMVTLMDMPLEVLHKIFWYLDSLSLRSISQTQHYLRDVCQSLLEGRGIVTTEWEKDNGVWKKGRKRWFFSKSFGSVDEWELVSQNSRLSHIETCRPRMTEGNESAEPFSYIFQEDIPRITERGSKHTELPLCGSG